MSILKSIHEQSVFGFSGKINILDRASDRYIGEIKVSDGQVINCYYRGGSGKRSLVRLIIDDLDDKIDYSLVTEPEVIEQSSCAFKLTYDDVVRYVKSTYEQINLSKGLRPDDSLNIVIKSEFIKEGEGLDSNEFDVLCSISEDSSVKNLYGNSILMDYEVTRALVSLRRKKALSVLNKKK